MRTDLSVTLGDMILLNVPFWTSPVVYIPPPTLLGAPPPEPPGENILMNGARTCCFENYTCS